MYVNNSSGSQFNPLLGSLGSSGLRGVGFGSFSFAASIFSSSELGGLNSAFARYPSHPGMCTLGGIFNSLSMLQSYGGAFGCGCYRPPPPCPPPLQQGRMWDVFFDAKTGTNTQQWSPLVLDLNGNGKADITGSNIKGNGKLEGPTVKGFDLNPEARQWETKSVQRRPGHNAPELPADASVQVFDKNGKRVKTLSPEELKQLQASNPSAWNRGGGDMGLGLGEGMRAEFRDANGRLVSELKKDGTNNNQFLYFWGNKNENEWTKAWDSKGGGDGMLVWDVDGDGKITSGKELFGHVDANGKNSFKNGYEKLAHYFDKDGDGVVRGEELRGLKIWEDRNGDGVTQQGELVDLEKHGIRKLNTRFNEEDMGSTYGFRQPGQAQGPGSAGGMGYPHGADALMDGMKLYQQLYLMQLMQYAGFGQF